MAPPRLPLLIRVPCTKRTGTGSAVHFAAQTVLCAKQPLRPTSVCGVQRPAYAFQQFAPVAHQQRLRSGVRRLRIGPQAVHTAITPASVSEPSQEQCELLVATQEEGQSRLRFLGRSDWLNRQQRLRRFSKVASQSYRY